MIDPNKIRKKVVTMAYKGQTAHVACALSIVDILCVLYSDYRDHEIILSKGHGAMALYAIKNEIGEISDEQIENYFKNGSDLFGLVSGFGSLGHGLPIALGQALALKRLGSDKKVFVIVGDGEMQEGSCKEAIEIAYALKLGNLVTLIDCNGWQAMKKTSKYSDDYDGHDHKDIRRAISLHWNATPKRLNTIKGFGISFMEEDNSWHYQRLDQETYERAMLELDAKNTVGFNHPVSNR